MRLQSLYKNAQTHSFALFIPILGWMVHWMLQLVNFYILHTVGFHWSISARNLISLLSNLHNTLLPTFASGYFFEIAKFQNYQLPKVFILHLKIHVSIPEFYEESDSEIDFTIWWLDLEIIRAFNDFLQFLGSTCIFTTCECDFWILRPKLPPEHYLPVYLLELFYDLKFHQQLIMRMAHRIRFYLRFTGWLNNNNNNNNNNNFENMFAACFSRN